ncbi:type IX secretion system sortase PorU [Bacteroidota bacterium]
MKKNRHFFKGILYTFLITGITVLNLNAQTGPGGIGNNQGAGNLKFWLRGDSATIDTGVDTLFDLSGYNNHFVQSNTSYQPAITTINGFDVLDFNGAGDFLLDDDGESYINGQSAFTLLFLIKSDLTGTDKGFFIADDPGSTDDSLSIRYDITGDNGGQSNIITAGTGANGPVESSGSDQSTSNQLITFSWASNTTPELHIDGTQDALSYSNLIVGSISGSDKVILGKGSQDTGAGDGWDGIIGEVIYFNIQLNSAERIIVENYLAARYNLSITNDEYASTTYIYDVIGIGQESDGDHNGSVSAGFGINEDNSTLDSDGEYIFTGHDNTTNDIASIRTDAEITNNLGAGGAAWNRDWYLEKSAGADIDIKFYFDFSDGIEGGGVPQNISDYRLIYRPGTSGNYTAVTTSNIGIQSSDQVYFEVANADISDGYYTLGTVNQTNSPVEGTSTQTWYTLVSGDWEDDQIWTLDPSGALPDNPETEIPDANDNVVVLSGKTVTVNANNYDANSISVEGRLYLGTTNGHDFIDINGNGRIYIEGDYFPAGDSTDFVTSGLDEGTVVYSGGVNFDLTEPRTFYNMEIIMDDAADVVTLECDYIINGNLKVEKGILQINDAVNTVPLVLDIGGDIDVDSDGSITVGTANAYDAGAAAGYGNYHKGIHQVYVGGDFLNQGTVRFTNQAVPNYSTLTTTGGVSLVFDGAANNSFTCENTTDLYNFVIDKGTDQTYELSVYAEDTSHFAMFGQNNDEWNTGSASNPENRKALWIKAGTMSLSGEIYIPSLTEGSRDYSIGENARIVLNGPNVFLGITARVAGDFPSDLSHAEPSNYSASCSNQGLYVFGKLEVNNGYFDLGWAEAINFRDEAPGVIEVNGGTLEADEIAISSSASAGNYSLIVTGGTIKLTGESCPDGANAILHLDNSDMAFTMSGGEIRIEGEGGVPTNGILIGCDEGNYNVTGGTVYIDNTGADVEISSTANLYSLEIENNADVILQSTIEISDSLAIRNGASLNAAGYTLSVGGSFIYDNGASFTHGNNTTKFIGSLDTDIEIGATTGSLGFYNLVIEKDKHPISGSFYDVNILECTGRTTDPTDADNTIIDIANDLTINRGQFTIQRYTVSLSGDVAITDGKMTYNSALPGRLTLEGAAAQTITGSAIYSPVFGNIELDNTNGGSIATDIDLENFILTTGILDISTNRLTVDTNFVENGNAVAFSATKMIQTSASHGARGLKLKMDDDYTGGATVNFPVGSNGFWAEVDVNINTSVGSVTGYLNITPVNLYHPTRPSGGCDALEGYWKTRSSGLSSTGSGVEYEFYITYGDPSGGGDFEYYLIDGVWTSDDNHSAYPGWMEFNDGEIDGFPVEADFTIGKNACFNNVDYVYSVASGDWDAGATWNIGAEPETYDYVYILDGDIVDVTANGQDAGKLIVYSGGTLDISTYTGLTYNIVKGGGEIRISSNTIPAADYEEFVYNDTAIFEYYGGTYAIPTDFTAYPNLEITGTGAKTLPNQDVLVKQNLTIDDETLILDDGDDLFVNDSIIIDNAGILQYPTDADPCNVTVFKSVDLSGNSAANTIQIEAGGSNTGNHNLYVWEDIILNSNAVIDFYDAADNAVDLYFDGDGNSEVNDAGGIALFSTTRLVYSSPNYTLNNKFYNHVFSSDDNGNTLALGDIIRLAKNDAGTENNKRNFTLLGDPALRMPLPEYDIITDSINNNSVSNYTDTLKALTKVTIHGHIENNTGSLISSYNGLVYPLVLDKKRTISTLGNDGGSIMNFQVQNNILYKGKASVINGKFLFTFVVPKDISYNFDKGKISYYSASSNNDAKGFFNDFIIGGSNNNAEPDNIGPTIQLYMNDENFVSGGVTDENPRFFAVLVDSSGINTVGNGIGHDITATLDNNTNNVIVLNDYYESDVDNYQKGKIEYLFSEMDEGDHNLKLKVWDVYNNSSEENLDFTVAESENLTLKNLFNYPNPFTDQTAFYFDHNRPNEDLEVLIQIFTVSGKLVKTINTIINSNAFRSEPINWDGLDDFGDKIGRGVYIYQIKVRTIDGETVNKIEKLVILK